MSIWDIIGEDEIDTSTSDELAACEAFDSEDEEPQYGTPEYVEERGRRW